MERVDRSTKSSDRTETTRASRVGDTSGVAARMAGGWQWAVGSAAALLVFGVGLPQLAAQEASSDEAGVIERGGDDQNQDQDGDQNQDGEAQQADDEGNQQESDDQGGQGQGTPSGDSGDNQGAEDEGQVITPDNADPNEKYNLPPNFNADYEPSERPDDVKVTIDFRQAKLEEVVKFFSGAMNKNFIIADSIQSNKTITIISPQDVSLDEAYRAFLAALEMNGLTIVEMGKFLKIVQSKQAISEPSRTYEEGERIPDEARMVTAIVPVENAGVERIQEVIGNFTSQAATVIPFNDKLIISENASNLNRIRRLVERLDKGGSQDQVFVYKVRYAGAQKIADKLSEIFKKQGNRNNKKNKKTGRVDVDVSQMIADKRTNQLIIVTDRDSFKKVEDLIEMLDVPTQAGGGQVHVRFLEYADAEELSSTLSNLVSAAQGNRGGNEGGTTAGILQGKVQITAYKPNNALVVVSSAKDFVALQDVIDRLDQPRRQVYVEAVIMEIGLDTNRTLGLGLNAGLGQDFQGVIPDEAIEQGTVSSTSGLMVGQSNFPGLSGLTSALSGTGGAIGLIGPLVQIPGTQISLPAFAMLLEATQTDNSVNILSTPSVMTMDNEEAEIVVGERVPFLRGVSSGGGLGGLGGLGSLGVGSALGGGGTGTGTGGNQTVRQSQGPGNMQTARQAQTPTGANQTGATQTGTGSGLGGGLGGGLGAGGGVGGLGGGLGVSPIDYQDVGLTLQIKPQVNESRYVRLEVDQEVSDIKGAGGSELVPTQTRRNAKTTVLVKDQQTVVIGGLMRDVQNKTVEKVPFFGDIPLVGTLFQKTSTITTKQNLVLMLTPYIISDQSDMRKIYERKLKERRELLKLFGRHGEEYMKSINYQKKAGLVGRMKRKISTAIEDKRAREEAREAFEREGPKYRILGEQTADGASDDVGSDGDDEEGSGSSKGADSNGEAGAESPDGRGNESTNTPDGAPPESEESGGRIQ